MPRPPAADPLVPCPLRLPASTVARFAARAEAEGCSLSDVFRSYLSVTEAKPLGTVRPARRERKRLAAVSRADPALMRQLASIGNNLNQIARTVNAGLLSGEPITSLELLVMLQSIERELTAVSTRYASQIPGA